MKLKVFSLRIYVKFMGGGGVGETSLSIAGAVAVSSASALFTVS